MTLVDRTFLYRSQPGKREMDALDQVRSVYGIYGISFDDRLNLLRVQHDATRLAEYDIAALLRAAGFAVA
jgi:hypothetical protein